LKSILPAATLVILACSAPAAGGGEPDFYENGRWQDGQHAATKSKLVIRGRVAQAGKASGKGWDGNYDKNSRNFNTQTCKVEVRQDVTVEIEEVLLGKLDDGLKRLTVKMSTASLSYRAVNQYYYQLLRSKKIRTRNRKRSLPVSVFSLRKGRDYIFYLDAPATKDKGGKKQAAASHIITHSPMSKPEKDLLRSIRAFCEEIKLWHKPPKLAGEQQDAVKKLIADLGAQDFRTREKADKTLRAIGARLRPQLDRAARDRDEERSFRARAILEVVKPEPGKVEFPRVGRRKRLPEIFKKRPKPKPKPETPPEPGPEPGPEPAPGPGAGDEDAKDD